VWAIPYGSGGSDDIRIIDPSSGYTAGFARLDAVNGWSITEEHFDGSRSWVGYAPDSLAVGCDVLINGHYVATGRHDSRRIGSGAFHTADRVHADNARKHSTACAPCRDAGQVRGWIECVAG
jgi:hypothetical protein